MVFKIYYSIPTAEMGLLTAHRWALYLTLAIISPRPCAVADGRSRRTDWGRTVVFKQVLQALSRQLNPTSALRSPRHFVVVDIIVVEQPKPLTPPNDSMRPLIEC